MNARWTGRALTLVAVVALAGATVVASAHELKERVPLDWKRDPKAVPRHADAAAPPAAPELPSELRTARPGREAGVAPSPGPPPQAPRFAVDPIAIRAGEEMAREAAQV